MKRTWHALAAAIQFLTRMPLPVEVPFTNEVLKRSTLFFPIAGMLVGLATWGSGWLLQQVLPAMPAAAITLFVMIAMTGGLHLDGLMDTADGILSHRSRERMLEIMKDSRVGAMGVIVCVAFLLLQWTLIVSLMEQGYWGLFIVLPFMGSRFVMVWAIARHPYARAGSNEGGMGGLFKGVNAGHAAGSALISLCLSVLLLALERFFLPSDFVGSVPFGMLLIGVLSIMLLAYLIGYFVAKGIVRKLGGLTGDTYGAICEIVLTFLFVWIVACTTFI